MDKSLNAHTMNAYAMAVEQDRLFTQMMLKTMTPEQINRFCFENGFAVPTEEELEEKDMHVIRRTYWTNGLVTEREVEVNDELIVLEKKRVNTCPGIEYVLLDGCIKIRKEPRVNSRTDTIQGTISMMHVYGARVEYIVDQLCTSLKPPMNRDDALAVTLCRIRQMDNQL